MNILVTGAKGFIGKNLLSQLRNIHDGKAKNYAVEGNLTLYEYDLDSTPEDWTCTARMRTSFSILRV